MKTFRTVFITGASSGIGAALARYYINAGATVGVGGRDAGRVADVCGAGANALPLIFETTDAGAAKTAVEGFVRQAGSIDLAILNAGTHEPTDAAEFSASRYARLMDVNYVGTLNCLEPVIAAMRAQGRGMIAITGSVAGYKGLPRAGAYCASKAAMMRLAETLRTELAPLNIDVKLISPGFVRTPLTDKNDFAMPFLMDVDEARDIIVRGLTRKGYQIVFPQRLAWGLRLLSALPAPIYFAITEKMLSAAR
ncbi:MAG: SDR family NAD(P)-dependent oxidoreductase [Parvularculaceae bacterium]